MFAEFIQVAQTDNSKLGTVYINPKHVVKIEKGASDPEKQLFVTLITDINKVTTRVEGTPSQIRSTLQNPR